MTAAGGIGPRSAKLTRLRCRPCAEAAFEPSVKRCRTASASNLANNVKKSDWKETAELVGIAAIVASLVFVGMQMKQSQDIALSQASQARTAISIETILSTAENANYVSAVAKGRSGNRSELSLEEQVTMSQYAIAVLMSYEDQHFQYSSGFVTEDRWQAARSGLKNFLRDSANIPVRQTFERLPDRFSGSFREVVNGLITEIDASKQPD